MDIYKNLEEIDGWRGRRRYFFSSRDTDYRWSYSSPCGKIEGKEKRKARKDPLEVSVSHFNTSKDTLSIHLLPTHLSKALYVLRVYF
jgi:hypothetical protein